MTKRQPERSCVVCRTRAPADELVRLVRDPAGQVIVDFRGKLPGRGAWVHPGCLTALEADPRALHRAFKQRVTVAPLVEQYGRSLNRALRDGISMAAAAGTLVGGRVVLGAALAEGQIREVLVASDAAERTLKDLSRHAAEEILFTPVPLTAADLGELVGRGPRAALGLRRSRATLHLRTQLRRLRQLG